MNRYHLDKKGFTLIELIIVITLVAITAGISADIIITLVRSYNKTLISSDLERAGTLTLTKFEKDIKPATKVTTPNSNQCGSSITFNRNLVDGSGITREAYVTYAFNNLGSQKANMTKDVQWVGLPGENIDNILIDPNLQRITVDYANSEFCVIGGSGENVTVVLIRLALLSTSTSDGSTSGSISYDQTIVLRGSY